MIILNVWLSLLAASAGGGAITIGSYGPLTGGSAPMGIAMKNGAHLAAEEINAAGGVLGKKLVLVDADDESKPENGPRIAKDLIEKEHAVAIVGPVNTGVANASTQVANERHVPQVIAGSTGANVNELFAGSKENYVFRLAASDAVQSEMMVTEAFAARGKTKVAILADDSPYGTQGRGRLESLIAKRGLKPAYVGTFKVGQPDMSAHVAAARAAGAEVLLLYALGGDAASVSRALEKANWRAPMIGTFTLATSGFLAGAGPYGEGASTPQTLIEEGATEPNQVRFMESYRKRYGTPHLDMASVAAQGYDAVRLLAIAIRQAGGTEGAKVKAAMEDLKEQYDGVTGSYMRPWMSDDHEAVTPAAVQWARVKSGQVVPEDRSVSAR